MKIVHISDTHGMHDRIDRMPVADIIIHSGDFSNYGTEKETLLFLNWFIEIPYTHKIFVTGNHDLCLWEAEQIEDLPSNIHFLQDKYIEINKIKFFGLGYNHNEKLIPKEVDVLITHEPPSSILDNENGMHYGNELLLEKVFVTKPKIHLFGHAHDAYGETNIDGIKFINSSIIDNNYKTIRKPHIIEL